MGFAAAHQPRFRVFYYLMAALWAGMILLGAVRFAVAVSSMPHASQAATISHVVYRCPMCAGTHMAGMKPGMKCCCQNGGSLSVCCRCACRPQSQPATLTVLVWSPLAMLPVRQVVVPPLFHSPDYPAAVPGLTRLLRSPQLRPPRLL